MTEVHQVLVVGEDLDREWRAMEVMPPGLQGMDDGKELLVIDIIVLLGRDERLGEVGTGMSITIGISLEKNSI